MKTNIRESRTIVLLKAQNGGANYRVIVLSSEKPINHKNVSVATHSCPSLPALLSKQNLLTVNTLRNV